MSEHEKECRSIIIDLNLPAFDEEKNRVGIWWYQLTRRYLTSCKGSLALLSIFHGPRVELLFNMIGNILDKQSGRINIDTYSAILTVKYNFLITEQAEMVLNPFHSKEQINYTRQFLTYVITCVMLVDAIKED